MKNCRRWRRRTSNIKPEFKAKIGWLETHLWHAKRCKMIEYWGYKIAAHLNEKCLKSTFRSSTHGVILHDFSYWQPFWMEAVDMKRLASSFGNGSILDIILEYEDIQICPVKIVTTAFSKPLFFLHPASIQTGILEHASFKEFITTFGISFSSASESLCTFKLDGPKSEQVMKQFFNLKDALNSGKIEITDPRVGKVESNLVTSGFDEMFTSSQSIPISDSSINNEKSELFLTNSLSMETGRIPISVSKNGSEYFLICPRKWARIIWYCLIKIKPIKVAGINQIDMIAFENEHPVYPRDFVGSPAYEIWSLSEKTRLEEIHNKRPPAKRPNYAKLGIESPFKSPFGTLKCLFIKSVVEIEGKGFVSEMAEIYTNSMVLIGFVTSASRASLKKGRSTGIASINANFYNPEMKNIPVLVRNFCSPEVFRGAILSCIDKNK